jgi:phage terminase large subunit-like protein
MPSLAEDLKLALDRVEFAKEVGIHCHPWQEELLRSDSDRVLLNCARQSGKSTMSAVIALHRALYHPGSLVLCLAPSERQSKELFGKVSDSYRQLRGSSATEAKAKPASDRKLGMHLPNGSRIEALPGSEKTIRGFSGTSLLILDEAARIDDGLYYAVRSMLAVSGGSLMMLSTPFGKRGVFYEEWTSGRRWDRYEVTAAECPSITAEFIEEERESLPSWTFRQEYECSFEETEDQVFQADLIDGSVTDEVKPLFMTEG